MHLKLLDSYIPVSFHSLTANGIYSQLEVSPLESGISNITASPQHSVVQKNLQLKALHQSTISSQIIKLCWHSVLQH